MEAEARAYLRLRAGRSVSEKIKGEDSLKLFLTLIHGLALNCFCPQMGRRQVVLLIGTLT